MFITVQTSVINLYKVFILNLGIRDFKLLNKYNETKILD